MYQDVYIDIQYSHNDLFLNNDLILIVYFHLLVYLCWSLNLVFSNILSKGPASELCFQLLL